MVMMYVSNRVLYLFGDNQVQHTRVLLGGAGLLAVALIRAVYIWFAVGAKQPAHTHDHDHDPGACDHSYDHCGHDHAHDHYHHHEHEHGIKAAASPALTNLPLAPAGDIAAAGHSHARDHDHDHGHHHHDHGHDHSHGNDHDHDHDHGWAPWRFMLLLLPVILFLLGLPNKDIYGGEMQVDQADMDKLAGFAGSSKGDEVKKLSFLQLRRAGFDMNVRDDLEGRLINVTGKYAKNKNGDPAAVFQLVRFQINCCAADAIPLNAIILINPPDQAKFKMDPAQYKEKWVSVTGRVHFQPQPNGEYLTAIYLYPSESVPLSNLVEIVPPDPNPYAS
jgi:hypothetical protein